MWKYLFFVFISIQTVLLESNDENTRFVVSSTPNPSKITHVTSLENQLINITSKLETLTQKVNELHKAFEKQDALILNQLTTLTQKITAVEITNREAKFIKKSFPRNCREVQLAHNFSGIYLIQPEVSSEAFMVVCDMETHGGGWTYFLRRFDGSQEFYQDWENYKKGFGHLGGEFWLGLEHLYQLTKEEVNELLVELVDWDLKKVYARYDFFCVGSEDQGYALKLLSGFNGTAGDSFTYHVGMKFSTRDKDQDLASADCATYFHGAWWYNFCMTAHLTGPYKKGGVSESEKGKIMGWDTFRGDRYSLKKVRMMVRPRYERSSPFRP